MIAVVCGAFLSGCAKVGAFVIGGILVSTACMRVLDYCECCHRAWAWRRRVLDDGKSSPLCRKCAQQVDRVRRNLSLRKG